MVRRIQLAELGSQSSTRDASLEVQEAEDCNITLHLSIENGDSFTSESKTHFDAFRLLRRQVEAKYGVILCNGSRPNILISGMSRQSSLGEMGYLVEMGKPARLDNLVSIYDVADIKDIAEIASQDTFTQEWYKRNRKKIAHPVKTGILILVSLALLILIIIKLKLI